MPYINANGAKLYYEEKGIGFPLIFLHLWPCDHLTWMFQTPLFSEYFRVITPDIRGLGLSDKPNLGYSLDILSRDLLALMNRLEIKRAFVVGCSLGGSVAMRFSIDYPWMVKATIWAGAPKLPLDEYFVEERPGKKRPLPDIMLEALESKGYLHYFQTMWRGNMSFFFSEEFAMSSIGSYLIRYLFEERYARLNADPGGLVGIIKAMKRETIVDELAGITVPTAIVVGDGDPGVEASKEQHQHTPGSQFFLIKDSGHMCMMDQAEQFNTIALTFLNKHLH